MANEIKKKLRGYFHKRIDGVTNVKHLSKLYDKDRTLVRIPDKNGDYPFYLASKYQEYQHLAILLFDQYPQVRHEQPRLGSCKNEIHLAVKCNSYHLVKHLLHHDPDYYLNVKDSFNLNALQIACLCKRYELIQLILDRIDDAKLKEDIINNKDKDGNTSLHNYVKHCNKGRDKFCLEYILQNKNINVNVFNTNGSTALYTSIQNESYYNMKILLDNEKVRVDICCPVSKESILHAACTNCNLDAIQLIFKKCPKLINAKNDDGTSPLMKAVKEYYTMYDLEKHRDHVSVVSFLLQAGASINCKDKTKTTPLIYICQTKPGKIDWTNTTLHDASNIFEILLNHESINVNIADNNKNTALHHACNIGNVNMVKRLLEHDKIDVNKKNDRNHTPLMSVISEHPSTAYYVQIVKLLLAHEKTDINTTTLNSLRNGGRTALHQACILGQHLHVEELLRHKSVDVNGKHMGGIPLLFEACSSNNMNGRSVRLLLQHKECQRDITSDVNKRSVFHYAIMHKTVKALDEIMFYYPEINLEKTDSNGNTIFHYVIKESIEIPGCRHNIIHRVDDSVNGTELIEEQRIMSHYPMYWDDSLSIIEKVFTRLPFRNLFTNRNVKRYSAYDLVREERGEETPHVNKVKKIVNEYIFNTRCHTYNYMKIFMRQTIKNEE